MKYKHLAIVLFTIVLLSGTLTIPEKANAGVLANFSHSVNNITATVSESVGGFFNNIFKKTTTYDRDDVINDNTNAIANLSDSLQEIREELSSAEEGRSSGRSDSDGRGATLKEQPTVTERIIEQPIIIQSTGITKEELNQLENKLRGEIANISSIPDLSNVYRVISQTNKIDKLSNITLTNVSGLTDSDIPDSITASSYLPLSGGTLTGVLTITNTTSTSTLPYLTATQTNLGTVVGGTWQASTIGEIYGGTGQTTYSTGDILYADSSNSLTVLSAGSNGQVLKLSSGIPSWDTDNTGSGGAGLWATTTDSLATYPTDVTDVVVIGNNATTTTGNILEVTGNSLFRGIATTTGKLSSYSYMEALYFNATSTTASTFPYASSTAITVSGSTYLGSLTGILQGINGLVSASSSMSSAFIEDVYLRNDANDTTTGVLTASSYLSSGLGTSTLTNLWASQFQAGSFIQTPYFNATSTTATSTIAWGLEANALNITSTTATSTFAQGIDLANGCFSINGTCVGGASVWASAGGFTTLSTATDFVGIGTSTPWGQLSVNPSGISGPSFVVGSSTATDFVITNGGRVGVGTSSPESILHIEGASGTTPIFLMKMTSDNYSEFNYDSNRASEDDLLGIIRGNWNGTNVAAIAFEAGADTTNKDDGEISFWTAPSGTVSERMRIDKDGNVGIGTTSPSSTLTVDGNGDGNSGIKIASPYGYRAAYFAGDGSLNFNNGTNVGFLNSSGNWIDSSDIAYKKDIIDIKYGLQELLNLKPRSYKMKSNNKEHIGFIAQETELIIPEVVDGEEGHKGIAYGQITALTVKSIQELSSVFTSTSATTSTSTILSLYQGTTTPAFVIDESGNIGVGTTSPEYKMHVIGDVAATAFVNISTKTSKKDITYVTDEEKGTILEKLEAVGVAEYHYNHEDDDAPMRLGLIAEEAPTEVLSVSGKGVDIYKLVTFTLAGVQELAEKVGDLEVRLATVEAQLAAGVSGSGSSVVSLRGVIDGLSTLGTKVVDGVLTVTEFIADSISTKSLYVKDDFVIGSAEKPIGLTIYDKNGQIGCLEADDVVAGTISLKPGACSNDSSITTPEQTTSTTTTSTDTESPVIIINGNNPANINIGDAYSDLGAVVTDNVNDNLGITTYLDGTLVSQITLNTASSTTYTISYVAVDQAGNTATSTRQVIVSDPAETTASTATSTPQ